MFTRLPPAAGRCSGLSACIRSSRPPYRWVLLHPPFPEDTAKSECKRHSWDQSPGGLAPASTTWALAEDPERGPPLSLQPSFGTSRMELFLALIFASLPALLTPAVTHPWAQRGQPEQDGRHGPKRKTQLQLPREAGRGQREPAPKPGPRAVSCLPLIRAGHSSLLHAARLPKAPAQPAQVCSLEELQGEPPMAKVSGTGCR